MNTQSSAWMITYCPAAQTFLMGRPARHMHKPGLWNFFGGHVDKTELLAREP